MNIYYQKYQELVQKLVQKLQKVTIDKQLHFGFSFFISFWISKILSYFKINLIICASVSFLITFVIGMCKELIDKKEEGNFDKKDLKANFIGNLIGSLMGIC